VSDSEDAADGVARLERALERIAELAIPRHEGPQASDAPLEAIAARLDGMIARLRAALEADGG